MRTALVENILNRLTSEAPILSKRFENSVEHVGVRFVAIDELLPIEIL